MPADNTRMVHRLTEEAYRALEALCQPTQVGDKTTEIQAGFQLGQQSVLKMLRVGYVIGA